jgi:hypothetical protein
MKIIDKIEAYTQHKVRNYDTAHDWNHIQRVRKIAINIATKENELIGYFTKDGGSYSSRTIFFDQLNEEIDIRLNNKQNIFSVLFVILLNYILKISKNEKRSISLNQCINLIKKCFQG